MDYVSLPPISAAASTVQEQRPNFQPWKTGKIKTNRHEVIVLAWWWFLSSGREEQKNQYQSKKIAKIAIVWYNGIK